MVLKGDWIEISSLLVVLRGDWIEMSSTVISSVRYPAAVAS